MKVDWLRDIDRRVFEFVLKMGNEDFTYFKYSLSGDIYGSSKRWGLGQAVFATKILYMLNKMGEIEGYRKDNLSKFIRSFQRSNGYIYDPLISKIVSYPNFKRFLQERNLEGLRNISVKRAETRQAFAALFCLSTAPEAPFLHIPYSEEKVERYLSSLGWKQPWSAGSHFSHLLFFLKVNRDMFNYEPELSAHLTEYAIKWVNKLQSDTDGTWHDGEVSLFQKINGSMKILTGFATANYFSLNFTEKFIDTILSGINNDNACDNFNIIYCLSFVTRLTDYRKEEINKFCIDRLKIYQQYYHENDGGFSFYIDRANDTYYGAKITRGLNEPDIHGTAMFIWGVTLISRILKLEGLDFREPVT